MTKPDKKEDEKSLPKEKDVGDKTKILEKKDISKKEESTEDKLKNAEEKLLRTMAEMENQRRRFEKERQEAFEFGGFNFAKESLALLDNIDRAMTSFKNDNNLKNNKDLNKIVQGIEIVEKDLVSIFKKNGVEAIECINKKFDPNFHQAMLEVEDNTKDTGTVIQEIQKGYLMKDRLLRPSLVGVTKRREDKKEEKALDETKTNKNAEKK
tara:strand:- start:431 stop:1060 length:630 start_codon:yes stop_codon:yes gene_type:complete